MPGLIWKGLWGLVLLQTTAEALTYAETPGGFYSSARGWNSFALQANDVGFTLNQVSVKAQCQDMSYYLGSAGYEYCSLDSGWSVGDHGDDYGRIIPDTSLFPDLPGFAQWLHTYSMLLGIYILPGFFQGDSSKPIYGTDPPILLSEISDGNCGPEIRCQIDYTKAGAQEFCNSQVNQFAKWGVDLIKLDYVTPGSTDSNLEPDNSASVACYHKAIAQSGRQIRLDISWKLDYQLPYYNTWKKNADSMRIDQDINNSGSNTLVSWNTVQRTIEQYRQYMVVQQARNLPLTIYPDLDNLLVGNSESLTGLTDDQRRIMYSHWLLSGANLILGSDMTQLDTLGLHMLTNSNMLLLRDFGSVHPIAASSGTATLGNQIQTWVAGPRSSDGSVVLMYVNYGTSAEDLYAPPYYSGTFKGEVPTSHLTGFGHSCYKAFNIWNPSNDAALTNFSSLRFSLDSSEVIVLWLTPNLLAIDCGEATVVH